MNFQRILPRKLTYLPKINGWIRWQFVLKCLLFKDILIFRGHLGFEIKRYMIHVWSYYRKGLELVLQLRSWYIAYIVSKGLMKIRPLCLKSLGYGLRSCPKETRCIYILHEHPEKDTHFKSSDSSVFSMTLHSQNCGWICLSLAVLGPDMAQQSDGSTKTDPPFLKRGYGLTD